MAHEFVAYDANGDVVASQIVMPGRTLERFAAEFPHNDVAEVVNDREVRTIDGVDADAEQAWLDHEQRLRESGGPDDSAYRRQMIEAGRGHLLR